MSKNPEVYPLLKHLEASAEVFASGIIVCIVNLDLLPRYVTEYLESPDKFRFDLDILDASLDKTRIWIVKEKQPKPTEQSILSIGLESPPQETRKRNEFFRETLAATVLEECLPLEQIGATNLPTRFTYCPGSSYLGHTLLEYPSATNVVGNRHRADLFLVGYSGGTHSFNLHDPDVASVGWLTMKEYLSDHNSVRRIGGKTAVTMARRKLLSFLEAYWKNPDANQLSLTESITSISQRAKAQDFNKRKFPQVADEANESSPASQKKQLSQ